MAKKIKKNTFIIKIQSFFAVRKYRITMIVLLFMAVIIGVSTYAWLSTSLNVQIKDFNMIVSKNSGLSISFDGINFDSFVEISENTLINELKKTYPNNTSQWASLGLTPVSTTGNPNMNTEKFDMFGTSGIRYRNKRKENGLVSTFKIEENKINSFNDYIAFDLFLKNDTNSPVPDNLYLEPSTAVRIDSESTDEMLGLVNSIRIGFVKIGSVEMGASVNDIQGMSCNNNCNSIIFEPNSFSHTELSIEKSKRYNVDLRAGEKFDTFACIKTFEEMELKNTVSGSENLDLNYFKLQDTITELDFSKPLFDIPHGITKLRMYVWLEGQDIDSLETGSEGASISIDINFEKDTAGYNSYN